MITQVALAWRDRALQSLTIGDLVVDGAIVTDPLLGDAHVIAVGGVPVTAMSAIDWARPTQIPTVAAPAKIPAGAGSAILNTIATLAAQAGVPALRYAGPYPTPALFHTLVRSYRTTADVDAFSADVLDRALRLARDELPFDFVPAPFERVAVGEAGWIERRDATVERATLAGASYARDGSPARLVSTGDGGWSAELWFGDGPWAHIARLAADGALLDGPHPVPPVVSAVLGREFPPNLRTALAELVADAVPALLAHDARTLLDTHALTWRDLGARAARAAPSGDGFEVHAALWERIAPLGLARLALALAEALAPVVTAALLARIAAAAGVSDT